MMAIDLVELEQIIFLLLIALIPIALFNIAIALRRVATCLE